MQPDRGIVCTDIRSYFFPTIPDVSNILSRQSDVVQQHQGTPVYWPNHTITKEQHRVGGDKKKVTPLPPQLLQQNRHSVS